MSPASPHRPRPHMCLPIAATLALASGCVAPQRRALSPGESRDFRAEAVETLKQAAAGDDAVLRMQAIEAFQEVAIQEGSPSIARNVGNGHPGVCFAALMAVGTLRDTRQIETVRALAEDSDPNVRIGALFALHRMGDKRRTSELGEYLLNDRDARIRANAALAIGRLGEPSSAKVLERALHREKKDAVKLQILEGLAILGNRQATERLIFSAYSAVPDQAALALMLLTNAASPDAEEVFRVRLNQADHPEIMLQAARGLGRLGSKAGEDAALHYLRFNTPQRGIKDDPPEQQMVRIRALAALALGAIGDPASLGPLADAYRLPGQSEYVRLAIARSAIAIIDRGSNPWLPPSTPPEDASNTQQTGVAPAADVQSGPPRNNPG